MMAVSSFLNSRLVGRFGMRRLSHGALDRLPDDQRDLVRAGAARADCRSALFIALFAAAMFQFGWIGSNFNAIAMEPLGHVAGTASSVLGFMQTIGGGMIGAMIGQLFDGTVDAAGGRLLRRVGARPGVGPDRREGQAVPGAREADTLAVNSE